MPKSRQYGLLHAIDGRTMAARRARALLRDIVAAMGREPNEVESAVIDRILENDLVARKLSEKVASGKATDDEQRRILWHGRYVTDGLRQLGLRDLSPKVEKPTPKQRAAELARRAAA